MAKLKLDAGPEPEVVAIAISCHENGYRLCWALNRRLDIALTRRDSDIEEPGTQALRNFAVYDHAEPGTEDYFTLISNRGPGGVLVTEQRQADFFLLAGNADPQAQDDLLEKVRSSEFVLAAFPIDLHRSRSGFKLLR